MKSWGPHILQEKEGPPHLCGQVKKRHLGKSPGTRGCHALPPPREDSDDSRPDPRSPIPCLPYSLSFPPPRCLYFLSLVISSQRCCQRELCGKDLPGIRRLRQGPHVVPHPCKLFLVSVSLNAASWLEFSPHVPTGGRCPASVGSRGQGHICVTHLCPYNFLERLNSYSLD